ncbi:MAG TPA: DUF4142 domain-containing protein [Longimicrobiaceae bacterium]|nr:DUF4142 domain-containing protein [Longimicrobiaceae bacterium]
MQTKQALLAAAVLLAACGTDEPSDERAATTTDATSAAAAPAPDTAGTTAVTDPQIADIVVAANDEDIRTGELARTRAADPRVREFAERMVTDHAGVNQAASDLVARLGVTPEPSPTSTELREGGRKTRETLQGKTGAEFDRAYIDHEVAYHQAVLDAIDRTLVPGAQNAELKALLQQTRPAIDAHLQHAKQIQASLGRG